MTVVIKHIGAAIKTLKLSLTYFQKTNKNLKMMMMR